MSRTFISYSALAIGAVLIAGTPSLAHNVAAAATMQQPAPKDPPPTPPKGTKGSVAAEDAKDAGKVAVEKTGEAIEKAAVATKDAVVTASKKTKNAVVKGGEKAGEKTDETWLTSKIAGKINADEMLEDVDVDVKVKKNVVTITGDVPSVALRDRVLRIARETEGVADVVDRMTVRGTQP